MPNQVLYVDQCPTCGRKLQISLEYLGQIVACKHCHRKFRSCGDSDTSENAAMEARIELLLANASEAIA